MKPLTYETHFDAFLAFADAQPCDRLIDHMKAGWYSCAVGDFHREATSIPPIGFENQVELDTSKNPLLVELAENHYFIYECLNHGEIIGFDSTADEYDISTYGGLAEFMRDFAGNMKDPTFSWDDEDDEDDNY